MFDSFQIIDLSVPLEHRAASEPMPAEIHYVTHDGEGRPQLQQFFGVREEDLVYSDGLGWATRGDPGHHAHRHPRRCPLSLRPDVRGQAGPHHRPGAAGVVLRAGRRARRAAQGGRRVHHRRRPASRPATDRLPAAAAATSCCCKPGPTSGWARPTTSRSRAWGAKASLWLVEQGVKVIGIDAYTLDRPFADMVADYRRTGDGRYIWPAHFAGIDARILPDREAGQPRPDPPAARLLRLVPAGQDRRGQRRLVPGRGAGAKISVRLAAESAEQRHPSATSTYTFKAGGSATRACIICW